MNTNDPTETLADDEIASIYITWNGRSGSTYGQLITECYSLGRHRALASRATTPGDSVSSDRAAVDDPVAADGVRAALAELVSLKDLKEEIRRFSLAELPDFPPSLDGMRADYARRKPLAWEAARAALTTQAPARVIVEAQALDEGLWFNAKTASEAYLQSELRRLHAAVEGATQAPAEETAADQMLGMYALQADELRDVLDELAPHTEGNLVARVRAVAAQAPAEPAAWLVDASSCKYRGHDSLEWSEIAAKNHIDYCRANLTYSEKDFGTWEIVPLVRAAAPTPVEPGNPSTQAGAIEWPKSRSVKSRTDMHPTDALQVGLDNDNDVMVSLWTSEAGYSSVEFCNPGGGGGGRYPNTRRALIALMVAMEKDGAGSADGDHAKGGD